MFEAVLGLISYVLQDRLQEDLGDLVKTSYFDKYQDDRLVRASVDQVQIQVNSSTDNDKQVKPGLFSSDVVVLMVTWTGPTPAGGRRVGA